MSPTKEHAQELFQLKEMFSLTSRPQDLQPYTEEAIPGHFLHAAENTQGKPFRQTCSIRKREQFVRECLDMTKESWSPWFENFFRKSVVSWLKLGLFCTRGFKIPKPVHDSRISSGSQWYLNRFRKTLSLSIERPLLQYSVWRRNGSHLIDSREN